ncbi:hypothetical protein HJC23_004946 [Cyclotella cryptica]|uniref:Uncharacterized protein n=1 Tax=Cyclotella cryptica TaxID=29204 RepID=A0ABD3PTN9_9STRA|eukprot:CCRYP_011893-RA/>CCRYP_011893-RA protein AED:0.38 eAED:0.38 QI:0/-1/0/1/-1/1/1/0/258
MSSARRLPESSMGWRGESTLRSTSPSASAKNFSNVDRILQKSENEPKHLTIQTGGAWTRSASPSPAKYDFAQRAKELRMSMERTTPSSIPASPNKMESNGPLSTRNGILPRSVGSPPTIRSPSPIASRGSFGSPILGTSPGATTPYRGDSSPGGGQTPVRSTPSFSSPYLNGSGGRESTPEGNTVIRSTPHRRIISMKERRWVTRQWHRRRWHSRYPPIPTNRSIKGTLTSASRWNNFERISSLRTIPFRRFNEMCAI